MKNIKNALLKNLNYLCVVGVVALGLMTIVATGGGGGDGGGGGPSIPSYTGLTDPATIDQNNAEALAVGAYEGGRLGAATGAMGVVPTEASGNIGYSRILKVSELLEDALRQVDFTSRSDGTLTGAIYTVSDTVCGNCGGSASYTISVDDQTGDFSGSFTFASYCEDGVIISGGATFSGQVDVNTEDLLKFSLSFSALTGTSGNESFTISGDISLDLTVYPYIMSISVLVRDESTGEVYWVKDYTMTVTEGATYIDIELSGTYYDPNYGYVILSTPTPLRIYEDHYWPSQGVLVVEGEIGTMGGNTKARLTFLSSLTYQVEADTDGDGEYDWVSEVLSNPLPCLNEDWGQIYYVFKDASSNPVYLQSHGTSVWLSAIVDYQGAGQLATVGLTGPPIDCYNAQFDYAKVDISMDGTWDAETTDVVGNANINLDTLTVSGVIVNGYTYPDAVATY
jgi:hypothetical protein